ARSMKALCARLADVEPKQDAPVRLARPHRGFVGRREPTREPDAVLPEKAEGQRPGDEVPERFGGMLRRPQIESLVHSAIGVRQSDLEVIERRAEGHFTKKLHSTDREPTALRKAAERDEIRDLTCKPRVVSRSYSSSSTSGPSTNSFERDGPGRAIVAA